MSFRRLILPGCVIALGALLFVLVKPAPQREYKVLDLDDVDTARARSRGSARTKLESEHALQQESSLDKSMEDLSADLDDMAKVLGGALRERKAMTEHLLAERALGVVRTQDVNLQKQPQRSSESVSKRDIAELQADVDKKATVVRNLRNQRHLVMEKDPLALEKIAELQVACRTLVKAKYGDEPYFLKMELGFPEVMPDFGEKGSKGSVLLELAPLKYMPYSVMLFLNMATNWKGGAFHRKADHVKQVTIFGDQSSTGFPLAFQEYHPKFPHKKWTMGYAGRPGGSAFYVSTIDNTRNHGPGSQGHATEADACFAKVATKNSKAVLERLALLQGAGGGNGFISDRKNWVQIKKFTFSHGAKKEGP